MTKFTCCPTGRKTTFTSPDLFDWAQTQRLVADPAVASTIRRARVSPARAVVAGIGKGGRDE
jgi:hypothetical protein